MRYAVPFSITSTLPADLGHIPISADIDFAELVQKAEGEGRLNPASIQLVDCADGSVIRHGLSEDLAHADFGRIEFPIRDVTRRDYEIRFETLMPGERRPHLAPPKVPLVGVGDLLRANDDAPHPVTLHSFDLRDLDGDGRADLIGTWNYYHRPGTPISGVIAYPRIGTEDEFRVGDLVRLRYRDPGSSTLHYFPGTYLEAAFGDLTGDGRLDLCVAEWNREGVWFFRNTGDVDGGGWPIYERHPDPIDVGGRLASIHSLQMVDVDGDGLVDLVINGQWIRNHNPFGWPFEPDPPLDLGSGEQVALVELTGDGRLDLISLTENPSAHTPMPDSPGASPGHTAHWRPRLDEAWPQFGDPRPLSGLPPSTTRVAAIHSGPEGQPGLLVQHNVWQAISLFDLGLGPDGQLATHEWGRAEADCGPLIHSDQGWPCVCDWDGDGGRDLLIGGGYGWPRIVHDLGEDETDPTYSEPELIFAEGEQAIRLRRDEILGGDHWHNMGYPYPAYVDWDGDGLPDLMFPNETNRIFWYRNVGTREQPEFGPRQQLIVDGYPDDAAKRARVAERALDKELPNHPYPFDETSPFFWRTGGAFADWNGDGLCDLAIHDEERKLTLFVQVDDDGTRRLRKERRLLLTDGREIDDSIVGREKHWTESFRAIDWTGDGRLDLIYNTAGTGHIYLLLNAGTDTDPVFDLPRQLCCYGEPISFTIHGPNAWPGDLDGDGKPDLLGCVEWSVYPFYAHAALEMERHPDWELGEPRAME